MGKGSARGLPPVPVPGVGFDTTPPLLPGWSSCRLNAQEDYGYILTGFALYSPSVFSVLSRREVIGLRTSTFHVLRSTFHVSVASNLG